jgi:hypothetical protein
MPSIVKQILFCCSAVLLFNVSYGQDSAKLQIQHIKKVYASINSYKGYKVVYMNDVEGFLGYATDNGASLNGYFRNDTLKKIVEWVGLSNKVIQNEYYLDNGKLVFVFSKESRYKFDSTQMAFAFTEFEAALTARYYYQNDVPINRIFSNKQYAPSSAYFLVACRDYAKLLSNRYIGSKNDE